MDETISAPILLAIPDEWQRELELLLKDKGLLVVKVSSREEALAIVQSQHIRGIITVAEWAIASDGKPGLIENGDNEIPSVMLVKAEIFSRFFDWYNNHYSPLEEYCHVPFGFEELWAFMVRVKMVPSTPV